jgi:hypothetical protein
MKQPDYPIPAKMPYVEKPGTFVQRCNWNHVAKEHTQKIKRILRKSGSDNRFDLSESMLKRRIRAAVDFADRIIERYKDIPGYEDIPEPMKTYTRASTEDPNVRSIVEEIKFLRDRKNADLTTIIRLTGQEAMWTRRVYDGYTYADICVTRENLIVFEERYKDLPIRPKPMKLD